MEYILLIIMVIVLLIYRLKERVENLNGNNIPISESVNDPLIKSVLDNLNEGIESNRENNHNISMAFDELKNQYNKLEEELKNKTYYIKLNSSIFDDYNPINCYKIRYKETEKQLREEKTPKIKPKDIRDKYQKEEE